MEYKVHYRRDEETIRREGIRMLDDSTKTVHGTFDTEADNDWKAIDNLKHEIFYEAKRLGHTLKRHTSDLLYFKDEWDIYGTNMTIVKCFTFSDFYIVKEDNKNE